MIKTESYGPVTEWNYTSGSRLMSIFLPPFWATVYFIDGMMIDTGSPSALNDLAQFMKTDGISREIRRAVITHWHEDHSGGAKLLTERFGVEVLASSATVEKVHKGYTIPYYRKFAWGNRVKPAPMVKILSEREITTPGSRFRFQIIEAQGHADGQLILLEKEHGLAFTGDTVMPVYRMLFGNRCDIQENIEGIYHTIKNLVKEMDDAGRPFTLFMSGNGTRENAVVFIKEKLSEIETLHAKAMYLKGQGKGDREILAEMFGKETPAAFISRGAFSRMNLVHSLLEWER